MFLYISIPATIDNIVVTEIVDVVASLQRSVLHPQIVPPVPIISFVSHLSSILAEEHSLVVTTKNMYFLIEIGGS